MYKYRCGDTAEFLKKTKRRSRRWRDGVLLSTTNDMWPRASVIGQLWQPRPCRLSEGKIMKKKNKWVNN